MGVVFPVATLASRDEPCGTDAQSAFSVVRRFAGQLKSLPGAAGLKRSSVSRERLLTRSEDGDLGLSQSLVGFFNRVNLLYTSRGRK